MTVTNSRHRRAAQHGADGTEIVWAEPTERHVRVFFAGVAVADSSDVLIVFKGGRPPVYYFPTADVRMDLVESTDQRVSDPRLGERFLATLVVEDRRGEGAVFSYPSPIPDGPDLSGYVSFEWDAMDAWFEEDEEILRHPRDPYKRVDVLHSSRHVRVLIDGTVVADTTRPMLLFETGLPIRYYIPKLDVAFEHLSASPTRSRCPYKGEAVYWNVTAGDRVLEDIVWSYPAPIPELPKIENLLSFFNEKVDLEVNGELLERPRTNWS